MDWVDGVKDKNRLKSSFSVIVSPIRGKAKIIPYANASCHFIYTNHCQCYLNRIILVVF